MKRWWSGEYNTGAGGDENIGANQNGDGLSEKNVGAFGGQAIETDGDLRALSLSTPIHLQPPRQKSSNTTCG